MCVIVLKPAGIELPSKDMIKKYWVDNPDGAGFSVTPKGSSLTHVEKGFLTLKHFYKYLGRSVNSIDDLVVLHFRWATHGYRSAGHTHPFPVSKLRAKLEQLKYDADTVVFHNGIIKMKNQPKTWSDTMFYVGGVLAYADKLDMKKIAVQTKGSRICIIQDGKPALLGDGWKEKDGLWYSNLSWENSKRSMVYYSGGSSVFQEMSDDEWNVHLRNIAKKSMDNPVKKPYEYD